ncbi:MAG: hypothetical protein F9K09_03460 [Flavobacteriales bacterium]|nr:MAG: hypothetical protein F9K09_03460 [Flavobacteriales bacterium]
MYLNKLFSLFDEEEKRRSSINIENPEMFYIGKQPNKYINNFEKFKFLINKIGLSKTTQSGENLIALKKFNLTIEEAFIIYSYTSYEMYSEVNLQLRNHPSKLDKVIQEYSYLLDQSLDKMPSFDNNIVYRDICVPDNGVSKLINYYKINVNNKVLETAFISSHISNGRWSDKETGLQIIIQTKNKSNGKDLRELSFNSFEEEVLFKSGTWFLVDSIDKKNNLVYLNEL